MFVFKAAVVGGGTMGGEIAQAIAAADIPVVVKDIEQRFVDAALEKARGVTQGQLGSLVKKEKLTQEQATKLFDTYNKAISAGEAKRESDFKEWMKTTVTNYQAALKKEWGAQHDANVVVAQRGMARVFSAEAKKLLDDTGLGSHPEFVKAFYQVGKMVSEDKPPNGAPTGARKGTAEVLYGQTN